MDQESIAEMKKKPGFIEFKILNNKPQLDDLWFMTGSRCNLSCAHCYVGSNPKNDTIQQITLEEVKPLVTEATEYGLKHIYFTGGEPFINKDMMKILEFCLQHADTTVLTNATMPISGFLDRLKDLQEQSKHDLSFRISLDHYDREIHESIRGEGNFDRTINNAVELGKRGFKPIITSTAVVYENNEKSPAEIERHFKELFTPFGMDIEVKLLPYNLEMGTNLDRINQPSKHVFISEHCMTLPAGAPENFQCHNGRTIEKINGKLMVYPCPIIYNDRRFELAENNLKDSFKNVLLTHKACFDFCYKSGGKCTN